MSVCEHGSEEPPSLRRYTRSPSPLHAPPQQSLQSPLPCSPNTPRPGQKGLHLDLPLPARKPLLLGVAARERGLRDRPKGQEGWVPQDPGQGTPSWGRVRPTRGN